MGFRRFIIWRVKSYFYLLSYNLLVSELVPAQLKTNMAAEATMNDQNIVCKICNSKILVKNTCKLVVNKKVST